MAHVGIERLAAGDGEEDAAEDDKALQAVADDEADRAGRVDGD